MKILKILAGALGVLILVSVTTPAFLSNHSHVERSIEIQAPGSKIFNYLVEFRNFAKWSPFMEAEPDALTEVQGSGVGTVFSWKGKKTGEGKMTLTRIEAGSLLQIKMNFIQPMPAEADVQWKIEAGPTSSKLTWVFDEDLSYFHRFFGLMMDKMLGAPFEKGLQNLKKQLEAS